MTNTTLKSMESHIWNPEMVLWEFNNIEKYPLSEKFFNDIKKTLLYSLETFSYNVENSNEYIEKLLNITKDDNKFSKFTEKEKWRFYSVIWDNYFALWNLDDTLNFYKKALEKWFTNIFEAYVNVFILKDIVDNPVNVNILITSIEADLEQILKEYPNIFSNQIRADIENLIFGWLEWIKNIHNLSDRIYNYELEYEKLRQNLNLWEINKKSFSEWIKHIVKDILLLLDKEENKKENKEENKEEIIISKAINNILFQKDFDYMFFFFFNSNLIETWFNLMEIYLEKWNKYKALKILKFMFDYWFENATFKNRWLIIKKLNLLLDDFPIDYNDISTYFKNLIIPEKYIVDYSNIFLKLWNLYQAFNLFITISELYPKETILWLKSILLNIINNQDLSQDETIRLSQFIEMLDSSGTIPNDKSFYDFVWNFL